MYWLTVFQSDLLLELGLEKQGVFKLDVAGAAAELWVITNCPDFQIQTPLIALNHRTERFRICLYHLKANRQIS